LFENTASLGGALYVNSHGAATIRECTFFANSAEHGSGIALSYTDPVLGIENTVVAFGATGEAVLAWGEATFTCCNIYGNTGGDWEGIIADQLGQNGNISEDPLFCDPENGDFSLSCASPCAPFTPPNDECDLIGAWPVGCETPVVPATWSGIKILFRD